MDLVFNRDGKYKNDTHTTVVTEEHVEAGTVFTFDDTNGLDYIRREYAKDASAPAEPKPDSFDDGDDIDKMTVEQLKEFAAGNEIDLGEATKKAEIVEVIKTAVEAAKAE